MRTYSYLHTISIQTFVNARTSLSSSVSTQVYTCLVFFERGVSGSPEATADIQRRPCEHTVVADKSRRAFLRTNFGFRA